LAISSLLLGSSPYDLLLMDVTWTPKYAAAGWLEPLEPWLGDDALADLAPGAELGNAFAGHLWRFPLVADMGLLFWRTDLMEAPPRTPAELETISRRLQAEGKVPWGYVWEGKQYEGLSCVMVEMLRGFGGRWLDQNQPELSSPAAIEATAWLNHLVEAGITPPTVTNMAEPEALQAFQAGDAAFMRNWPYAWALAQAEDSPVRNRVGVAPLPAATLGGWHLAVSRHSRHPDLAAQLVLYLTSAPVQKQRAIEASLYPTRPALYQDPEILAANPFLKTLETSLAEALARPSASAGAAYNRLSSRTWNAVHRVLAGRRPAAQALTGLARDLRRILRRGRP
jgi:multiple sugar transport system substrate-binding protein